MGIRGLTGWIKWAAPNTMCRTPPWNAWTGKKIGVDILGFLYKAKAQHQSPVLYVGRLIAAFKRHNIIPVPIFDGKPPREKKMALQKRSEVRALSDTKKRALREDILHVPMSDSHRRIVETELSALELNTCYLTSEERDIVKQLFYACGIVPLNATGEADSVLAYFAKREECVAVISNDLDLLTRGVEILLVPDAHALPGDPSGWIQYTLSSILRTVGFTYEQFVEMCVLMGSDYTVGLRSCPYKSAYWAIKYRGTIEKTLTRLGIEDIVPYEKAIEILTGVLETQESLMGEKQWEKWLTTPPSSEPDTLVLFRDAHFKGMDDDEFELLTHDFA